jgi:peptide/nickel transport system permease protein
MKPSLLIALPTFLLGILVEITFAMILAYCRGTYLDYVGTIVCISMMSISGLFYIIGGQYLFGIVLKLFPISGYDTGWYALKFVSLPILIGVVAGIGGDLRFTRTIFLEEINKDYIRTARAKGLPEEMVLFKHCLKNALIPLLTTVVMTIPFLFMGSLLMESFFAIPGLGSFTIDAIQAQDFAIVRSMVYLGSILYIVGLLLTDISYTLVDPRVRFE